MRKSYRWNEVTSMRVPSGSSQLVPVHWRACLAPMDVAGARVALALAVTLALSGCAESMTPAPRFDGAIDDDADLDEAAPQDSSAPELGAEDGGHLPTYEVCPSWADLCGPGESCVSITLRDAFGLTRTGATCSPPCTVDTECPPVGVQTAGCLQIAYPIAGVCVVRCDPDLPGQCAGGQECVLYAGEHWCLPDS